MAAHSSGLISLFKRHQGTQVQTRLPTVPSVLLNPLDHRPCPLSVLFPGSSYLEFWPGLGWKAGTSDFMHFKSPR